MSITEKSDEEIIKIAEPIWANLVKSSNIKDYGSFTKDLSSQMLYGANEVELGKQWANNELVSSLSEGCKAFGCIRRGLYVTILYKQTSFFQNRKTVNFCEVQVSAVYNSPLKNTAITQSVVFDLIPPSAIF